MVGAADNTRWGGSGERHDIAMQVSRHIAGLTVAGSGWEDGTTNRIVEVMMTASGAERLPRWPTNTEHVSAEELARRQGVQAVTTPADMARPGAFESDEELEEFLVDLYASRRAGMA